MSNVESYLTYIKDIGVNKNNQMKCLYLCKCGKEKVMLRYMVNSGKSKSCGCYRKESHFVKHNLKGHLLYGVWGAIKTRCYNEKSISYKNYGAKGVKMCDEWKNDFKEFYNWCIANGWGKGLHIDKDIIPKKLGIAAILYSPNTCCFVLPKENNNNRHCHNIVEFDGKQYNHAQIAEKFGVNYRFFVERLNRGWSLEDALFKPHQYDIQYLYNGESKNIPQLAKENGFSVVGLRKRLVKFNGDIYKAITESRMKNQFSNINPPQQEVAA